MITFKNNNTLKAELAQAGYAVPTKKLTIDEKMVYFQNKRRHHANNKRISDDKLRKTLALMFD